jgi:hypothetical protein
VVVTRGNDTRRVAATVGKAAVVPEQGRGIHRFCRRADDYRHVALSTVAHVYVGAG